MHVSLWSYWALGTPRAQADRGNGPCFLDFRSALFVCSVARAFLAEVLSQPSPNEMLPN